MTETLTNATAERIGGLDRTRAVSAELLDVGAVAALLDCSPRHVYRLSDCGKMPRPHKLGALVRWPRRALLDWIAAGCPAVRTVGRGGR
jgi:predicted DNA-binding transcriptional regulator AlpA